MMDAYAADIAGVSVGFVKSKLKAEKIISI
jgi:hypothetical protein